MQLESTLAQFPLPELISMIVGSSVTGVLEIGEAAPGRIFFRDGQIYHADADDHTGVPAVCQIFTQKDAPFRFSAGKSVEETTLWQEPEHLVEFAQRYAATWERVRRHIPSFECVPQLAQGNAGTMHVNDAAWQVLAVIDGQSTVRTLAEQQETTPLEIAAALCDLVEQDMVQIAQPTRTVPFRCVPATTTSRGFFGRLMANS